MLYRKTVDLPSSESMVTVPLRFFLVSFGKNTKDQAKDWRGSHWHDNQSLSSQAYYAISFPALPLPHRLTGKSIYI